MKASRFLLLLLSLGLLALWAQLPPASGQPDICRLPKVMGPCLAAIPHWFYNWEAKEFQEFTYGGCQGNANNFESLAECQRICG